MQIIITVQSEDRVCLRFLCVTENSHYEVLRQFYFSILNSALLLLLVFLGLIFYFILAHICLMYNPWHPMST